MCEYENVEMCECFARRSFGGGGIARRAPAPKLRRKRKPWRTRVEIEKKLIVYKPAVITNGRVYIFLPEQLKVNGLCVSVICPHFQNRPRSGLCITTGEL
jgi:hypothetical protein